MNKRRRWWIFGLVLVATAVALEVGVRVARPPRAVVVLVNGGTSRVTDVIAKYGAVETLVGDLGPSESTALPLENDPEVDVEITFTQEDNPMGGAIIAAEELAVARRDGMRVVLILKGSQLTRYVEEAPDVDDPSPAVRAVRDLYNRYVRDLEFPTLFPRR